MDIVVPRRELPERPAPSRFRWPWWAWLLLTLTVLFFTPPLMVLALRWLPPPTTAFMLQSEVRPVSYRWVPADRIADVARKAAVAAEDQKFYDHFGFDFEAIGKALEHNKKNRRKRGASTISQQVAKNLFLWPGRSWFRKGVEVTFTVLIELLWTKERILEVYLNVAEFGSGIYGVEAAAQKFFGKSAARLSPNEAARLAAVLPNPRRWRADRPGPYVQSRAQAILRLMGYGPPPAPAEVELLEEAPTDDADVPVETMPTEPAEGKEAAPADSEPAPEGEIAPEAPASEEPVPAENPDAGPQPDEAPMPPAPPAEEPARTPMESAGQRSLRPRSA